MGKQFRLYISHLDAQVEGSASVDLPAGPYALLDALEKARVSENEPILLEMDSSRCDELAQWFNGRESGRDTVQDVYRLNAFAEQMQKLDSWNIVALGGALRIEAAKNTNMHLARLCDLADNLHLYNFANASDDEQLGKFYVENDFIPEMENAPDSVIEKLDFEKIGREMREVEGGVYLSGVQGYLVPSEDIPETHNGMDMTPPKPDYTVLLQIGWPDCGDSGMLRLPAAESELQTVLDEYGVSNWGSLVWRCADCKIPSMADTFSTCGNMAEINKAAKALDGLTGIELSTCKALISVMKPQDLTDALALIEVRHDYALERDIASPADVGMSRLQSALQQDEIELLAPHVNLYAYGQSAMKKYGMELTEYGGLDRWDGEPVQAPQEEQAQTGGMEMM